MPICSSRIGFLVLVIEPYVEPQLRDTKTAVYTRVLPGHYFFMGDDRVFSCDSRTWGTVPRSSLIGRVVLTYWPPTRLSVR